MAANEIVLKVNGNSSQLLANIKELDRRVSLLSQNTKATTTALAAQAKQQAATAQAIKKPAAGPAYHQNLAEEKAAALSKALQEAEKTFQSLQAATDAELRKTLGETLKQQLGNAERMQKEMTREATLATGNIRDLLQSGFIDLAESTELHLEKLPEAAKFAGSAIGDFFKQVLLSGQSAGAALTDLRKTLVGIAEETSKAILPDAIGPLFVGLGSFLANGLTNKDGEGSGPGIRERLGELFNGLSTDEMGAKAWEDYLSFVQTDIPKAFGEASRVVGGFVHDMIFNTQSVGETWKNLGRTMSGIVSKMLSELAELAMRMLLFGKGADKKGGILGTVIGGIGNLLGTAATGNAADVTNMTSPNVWNGIVSAHGNVFSCGGLSAYSGSIVSSPTYFSYGRHERFARGAGLMGEAGPEAIMPLVRTASGDLGVRAANSGSSSRPVVNNNIRINADPALKVEQRETENDSGGMDLEVMVTQIVNKDMNRRGGSINQSMRQAWGLTPHTTRR